MLDSQAQAGSSLEILVDGVTVLTTQARRQFNFIVASSKDFVKGSEAAVIVNGKEANCTSSKEKVKIEGYTGELECAPFERICTGTKYCNNIFSCVEKKSIALDMEIPVTPVTPDPPVTPTGNSFNLRVTLYSILVLLLVCF